jgi:hypothetical protein
MHSWRWQPLLQSGRAVPWPGNSLQVGRQHRVHGNWIIRVAIAEGGGWRRGGDGQLSS